MNFHFKFICWHQRALGNLLLSCSHFLAALSLTSSCGCLSPNVLDGCCVPCTGSVHVQEPLKSSCVIMSFLLHPSLHVRERPTEKRSSFIFFFGPISASGIGAVGGPAGALREEKKNGIHLHPSLDPTPFPVAGQPNGSGAVAGLDSAHVFASSSVLAAAARQAVGFTRSCLGAARVQDRKTRCS